MTVTFPNQIFSLPTSVQIILILTLAGVIIVFLVLLALVPGLDGKIVALINACRGYKRVRRRKK